MAMAVNATIPAFGKHRVNVMKRDVEPNDHDPFGPAQSEVDSGGGAGARPAAEPRAPLSLPRLEPAVLEQFVGPT